MVEFLKLFPLISLILIHPIEELSLVNFQRPESPVSFLYDSHYIAPDNGFIKNIVNNDDLLQVTISLDTGSEVVYSGLTEITKKCGDRITKNEIVGKDGSISPVTKFILMIYEQSKLFPQFSRNSLAFQLDTGNILYMITDGTVVNTGYDTDNAGLFSQVKLDERDAYIIYCHLMGFLAQPSSSLKQGDRIARSGNTGYSENPKLGLIFEDEELGNDIRVIYFRN